MTQQTLPVRLHAASGSSEAPDAVEAGTAAARQALAGLGTETPAMIIVYASVRYDLPTLIDAIRAVTGDAPLVGETTSGHFGDGRLTEPASGVSVLAMTAGPYRFGVASVEHLTSVGSEAAGMELARAARAALGATPAATRHAADLRRRSRRRQQALVGGLHRVDRRRGSGGRRCRGR